MDPQETRKLRRQDRCQAEGSRHRCTTDHRGRRRTPVPAAGEAAEAGYLQEKTKAVVGSCPVLSLLAQADFVIKETCEYRIYIFPTAGSSSRVIRYDCKPPNLSPPPMIGVSGKASMCTELRSLLLYVISKISAEKRTVSGHSSLTTS